jgi:hypothetical protein
MRDTATQRAIAEAGGVLRLSRALGIKQPSVSKWKRIPAGHVLTIEGLTGISRHDLRPDIFGPAPVPPSGGGTPQAGSSAIAPPGAFSSKETSHG